MPEKLIPRKVILEAAAWFDYDHNLVLDSEELTKSLNQYLGLMLRQCVDRYVESFNALCQYMISNDGDFQSLQREFHLAKGNLQSASLAFSNHILVSVFTS